MGDIDGSSSAAQSAQSNETTHKKRTGFFGRLFSPKSADGDALTHAPHSQSSAPKLGLANLRRLRVEDVAIPKAEIIAVPDTMTKSELVDTFRSSTMTRLPVFSGTLDTPVGMVHLKDFALSHGFETEDHDFNLTQTLRPVLFVPPSMPLSVLLTKMQTERSHMALVIDEYGGVDGLVTIEGPINDNSFLIEALTPIEDFNEYFDTAFSDEEFDTIGGLVINAFGQLPTRNQTIRLDHFEFKVIHADERRLTRLRVTRGVTESTA